MPTFIVSKTEHGPVWHSRPYRDHREDYVYLAHYVTTLSKSGLATRRNSPYACARALTTSQDYFYRGLLRKGPINVVFLGEFCGQAVVAPRDM